MGRFSPEMFKYALCTALLILAASAIAQEPAKIPATIIQTATAWEPKSDVQVDLALIASDESTRGLQTTAERVSTWRERGYRVFGFASLSRVYDYYMKGGWLDVNGVADAGDHDGEIQRDRNGGKFGPHEFMMTPSLRLIEHKKLWAKAFIDAKVEGMIFEEPDLFMSGGYDEQFKKEWGEYYKEPWQVPHSSIGARVKSERLKSHLGYRAYKALSEYCKQHGGPDFKFTLATHSLPNYMLWGVSFNYYDTLMLPSVDILQAQVWTGTAKTPVLFEGTMAERLFDNAYFDYSYCANLGEATGKQVWNNMDPFEDEPGLTYAFYKRGFECTLIASMMSPGVKQWELLPWPNRIYTNDRIEPLYGTELQNVLTAMSAISDAADHDWNKSFPRTGILFSETALFEMRDPMPANPQSLFSIGLPLLTMGVPVDVVPLEGVVNRDYLDRFKVLILSYDFYKPQRAEIHDKLAEWVRRGGVLVVLGGMSAYNEAPLWWREGGYQSPVAHLLEKLGAGGREVTFVNQFARDIQPVHAEGDDKDYAAALDGLFDGLKGQDHIPRPISFATDGEYPELNYLHMALEPGRVLPNFSSFNGRKSGARFCDATGEIIYKFDTRGLKQLTVRAAVANAYIIDASRDGKTWDEMANPVKRTGREVHDGRNLTREKIGLSEYVPGGTVYLRFRDPSPQDGWGPLLLGLSLEPVPGDGFHEPDEEAPLVARDGYCISYAGLSSEMRPLLKGRNDEPIAFARKIGHGEAIVIGAPTSLFGSSKARADKLRALYTAICARHNLPLKADGRHHLRRGDYHIVYSYTPFTLEGRYIDALSPGLEMLTNPTIPAGKPSLLLDVGGSIATGLPKLLFASHRAKPLASEGAELVFRIDGPERIPAVCRVLAQDVLPEAVICTRERDGANVSAEVRKDPDGTLYIRFLNQTSGVRVCIKTGQ